MSGRHKMPPAGRRKAAAASAEAAESASAEQETVEVTTAAGPAEAVVAGETEPVVEEVEETVDAGDTEPDEPDTDDTEPDESDTESADADEAEEPSYAEPTRTRPRTALPIVLAAIALVLALTCGVLRWLTLTQEQSDTIRAEAIQAAEEITAQMLSYETETVDQQLTAARDRMTGSFLGTYTAMINEVIPAAHAQQIAAVAEVLRAGVVDAKPNSVELVLFVNQSVQVGNQMPKKSPSVARATLVKEDGRWLLSEYQPVPL